MRPGFLAGADHEGDGAGRYGRYVLAGLAKREFLDGLSASLLGLRANTPFEGSDADDLTAVVDLNLEFHNAAQFLFRY